MRSLPGGLLVTWTRPEHAEQLAALQLLVFPTLDPGERFSAHHYREHVEHFPQGQFVALDGDRVVGMTSTILLDLDVDHPDHSFDDVAEGGWRRHHRPDGRWMYGTDMGVHPEYRRRGIARALYAARQDAVRLLDLDGQVTVGMLSGFGALRHQLDIHQYYAAVLTGALTDPTVTAQIRMGFEPRGLVPDYVDDPVCDGWGVYLVMPRDHRILEPEGAPPSPSLGPAGGPPAPPRTLPRGRPRRRR